jgi:hypothetical protein
MTLPFVDRHELLMAAPASDVWDGLAAVLDRPGRAPVLSAIAGRVLGVRESGPGGPPLPERGAELLGFRVADSRPPELLALEGRHRFSRYALTFRLAERPGAGTLLAADTHAAFPGLAGRAYRALVIVSGAHDVAMRMMLRDVAHRVRELRSQRTR